MWKKILFKDPVWYFHTVFHPDMFCINNWALKTNCPTFPGSSAEEVMHSRMIIASVTVNMLLRLSDRPQLASQHMLMRHATLSAAVAVWQFRIISFELALTHWRAHVDCTLFREKYISNMWAPTTVLLDLHISGQSILSSGNTLIPSGTGCRKKEIV